MSDSLGELQNDIEVFGRSLADQYLSLERIVFCSLFSSLGPIGDAEARPRKIPYRPGKILPSRKKYLLGGQGLAPEGHPTPDTRLFRQNSGVHPISNT
jgi:hypothetical protein